MTRLFWALAILVALPMSGSPLPEVDLEYEIKVRLEPTTRELFGQQTIRWTSPAGRTIHRVPIHLYLNAFAHEDTTWFRGGTSQDQLDNLLDADLDPWGWIELSSLRQGGQELGWSAIAPDDGNPADSSLIEAELAAPLLPGETLVLELDWKARLPIPISRTGGRDTFFLVAQWFPKLAAWEESDDEIWRSHQFHEPTEFFSDFADYQVRIGTPEGWTVGATGRGEDAAKEQSIVWQTFRQRAVHDFAWVAGQDLQLFQELRSTPARSTPVLGRVLVPSNATFLVESTFEWLWRALEVMERRIGPYPWDDVTVVLPPGFAIDTGGMEYPTFFLGIAGDPFFALPPGNSTLIHEETVVHEFVHQYFHGALATNEFEEAFMDEGLTEYWTNEILDEFLGPGVGGTMFGRKINRDHLQRRSLGRAHGKSYSPILHGPSWLQRRRIGLDFYTRPWAVLGTAAGLFGQDVVDRLFATFYRHHAFSHPDWFDFMAIAREIDVSMADYLDEAYRTAEIANFKILDVDVDDWESPRGRMFSPDGLVVSGVDLVGLDPMALEIDGVLTMEITDFGSTGHDHRTPGFIERREIQVGSPLPEDGEFRVSRVRLGGPGRQHLPVRVRFVFDDDVVVEDEWNGRSRRREYRFVRPAGLAEIQLDPDNRIREDARPEDNHVRTEPDEKFRSDWQLFFGSLTNFLATTLGLLL